MKKIVVLYLIFVCGCKENNDIPIYGIVIENSSGNIITETTVDFKNFSSGGGIVIPGKRSSYFPVDHPLPEQVIVCWMDSGNSIHRVPIDVKNKLPNQFSGDLVFFINDGNKVEFQYTKQNYTK